MKLFEERLARQPKSQSQAGGGPGRSQAHLCPQSCVARQGRRWPPAAAEHWECGRSEPKPEGLERLLYENSVKHLTKDALY